MKSKIENDILILEDQILEQKYELEIVETQLEVNELNSTGSDEYFDWRKRALIAASRKRQNINSMNRQLHYWQKELKEIKRKEGLKKQQEFIDIAKEKTKIVEAEKTERHKINEANNRVFTDEFKRQVKKHIGEIEYIRIVNLTNHILNNNQR